MAHAAARSDDHPRRGPASAEGRARSRLLVPNAITFAGLGCGFLSIRATLDGEIGAAAALIFVAIVLDGIDGRLARLLRATSEFGAELDSLADFLCFGVAPAFLVYCVALAPIGDAGWLAATGFAAAMAFRLARFNAADRAGAAMTCGDFFAGLPAPAGAAVVLVPVSLHLAFDLAVPPALAALHVLATAGLCISRLPVYSGKKAGRAVATIVLACAAPALASLWLWPWTTLALLGAGLAASLPLHFALFARERRAASAITDQVTGRPA